jgi:hypothetical protein
MFMYNTCLQFLVYDNSPDYHAVDAVTVNRIIDVREAWGVSLWLLDVLLLDSIVGSDINALEKVMLVLLRGSRGAWSSNTNDSMDCLRLTLLR